MTESLAKRTGPMWGEYDNDDEGSCVKRRLCPVFQSVWLHENRAKRGELMLKEHLHDRRSPP